MFKRLMNGLVFFVAASTWPIWTPFYWVFTGKNWLDFLGKIAIKLRD